MKQVSALVISNNQVLKELQRRRDLARSQPRDISGSYIVWLQCPEIAREARPGQFVMVRCGGDCVLPRPFSIHRVDNGCIALFFAVWEDGKGTYWLSQCQKGETVDLFGPLGNGFSINPDSRHLLLVAGGTGIAPLCFLAEQALNHRYSVKLLHGVSGELKPSGESNPPQHYPEGLLPDSVDIETITSSPDGQTGMVIDLLTGYVDGSNQTYVDWADQVFACGPVGMYRTMARMPGLKNKPVQISLEVTMGCGRGVCFGCTLKTKQGLKLCCQDGPVFNLDDILWDELDY